MLIPMKPPNFLARMLFCFAGGDHFVVVDVFGWPLVDFFGNAALVPALRTVILRRPPSSCHFDVLRRRRADEKIRNKYGTGDYSSVVLNIRLLRIMRLHC